MADEAESIRWQRNGHTYELVVGKVKLSVVRRGDDRGQIGFNIRHRDGQTTSVAYNMISNEFYETNKGDCREAYMFRDSVDIEGLPEAHRVGLCNLFDAIEANKESANA